MFRFLIQILFGIALISISTSFCYSQDDCPVALLSDCYQSAYLQGYNFGKNLFFNCSSKDSNEYNYTIDITNPFLIGQSNEKRNSSVTKNAASNEHRAGFFQRIDFATEYTLGSGTDSLSMTKLSLQATFGLPCPTPDSPLILTPFIESTFLADIPENQQISNSLYSTGLNIAWMSQLNDRWGIYAYIAPTVRSDFKTSYNLFQVPSGVITQYTLGEQWKMILGVTYTGYLSWSVSPVCGLTWTPNDDWKLEFLFPRPKISRRISPSWSDKQYWAYIGGEYGAGIWSVESNIYGSDIMDYRDLRAYIGIENDHHYIGELNFRAELGIAFWRKLYYDKNSVEYCPNPGLFARVNMRY